MALIFGTEMDVSRSEPVVGTQLFNLVLSLSLTAVAASRAREAKSAARLFELGSVSAMAPLAIFDLIYMGYYYGALQLVHLGYVRSFFSVLTSSQVATLGMLRFRVFSDVCPWYTRRRSNFFLGIVWSLGILTCILALACCFQPYTRAWPDLCDVTDLVMVVTMVMQASADLVLTVSMVTVVQKIRQSVLDAKRRQRHPPKKARSWRGKRASVASLRSMVVAAVVTPLRTAVRLSTDTSRNDGTATSPGGQPTRSVTGAMPLAEDDDSQIVTAGGLSISLESESARNSYMAPTSVISSQIGQQKQPGRNSALSSINSSPHLQGSSQRESRSTTSNDHHQHLTAPSMDGDEQKASASIAASFHRIMIRLVVVIVIMSVAITADASIYLSVPGVLGDTISDTTTRLYMAGMIAGWTLLLALVRARDA